MFKGVDHVVVAVNDLEAAVEQYKTIYGIDPAERSESPAAGLKMAFFRCGGDSYIELATPSSEGSPLTRRLSTSGEGVYLVAMRVDDLKATLDDLRGKGVRLIGDPGPGNEPQGQVFIHPSATGGVLTQLVQR